MSGQIDLQVGDLRPRQGHDFTFSSIYDRQYFKYFRTRETDFISLYHGLY